MIKTLIGGGGDSLWSTIALLLMVATFAGVLVWTFMGRKSRFDQQSRLPLDEDETQQHAGQPHSR